MSKDGLINKHDWITFRGMDIYNTLSKELYDQLLSGNWSEFARTVDESGNEKKVFYLSTVVACLDSILGYGKAASKEEDSQ